MWVMRKNNKSHVKMGMYTYIPLYLLKLYITYLSLCISLIISLFLASNCNMSSRWALDVSRFKAEPSVGVRPWAKWIIGSVTTYHALIIKPKYKHATNYILTHSLNFLGESCGISSYQLVFVVNFQSLHFPRTAILTIGIDYGSCRWKHDKSAGTKLKTWTRREVMRDLSRSLTVNANYSKFT